MLRETAANMKRTKLLLGEKNAKIGKTSKIHEANTGFPNSTCDAWQNGEVGWRIAILLNLNSLCLLYWLLVVEVNGDWFMKADFAEWLIWYISSLLALIFLGFSPYSLASSDVQQYFSLRNGGLYLVSMCLVLQWESLRISLLNLKFLWSQKMETPFGHWEKLTI